MSQEVLLSVKDLRTEFFSSKTSSVTAIKDVSFDMYRGEVLGLVEYSLMRKERYVFIDHAVIKGYSR